MTAVFWHNLNMSLSASLLILVVLLLRLLPVRVPKWTRVLLWGIVAVRLVLPFRIESVFSLQPTAAVIPENIGVMAQPALETGIPAVNRAINPMLAIRFAASPENSANPMQVIGFLSAIVWLIGAGGMLLTLLFGYIRTKRRVRAAIPLQGNVSICDEVRTPFILGVFRPRIYLPSGLSASVQSSVLLHENAHLQRRDHWWKPLGYLLLAVHWFNPLCWVAYLLFCRDVEAACDERVIASMDKDARAAYSMALLDCSRPRHTVSVFALAFGEIDVKQRVKSVLHYRKPLPWIAAAAVLVAVIVAVCFLTSPKPAQEPSAAAAPSAAPVAPSVAPTEKPAVLPTAEPAAAPSPTAWNGDGHWYTFQALPFGLVSSTGRNYPAVYAPYTVVCENEVAIGRIKNVKTEVKVYTADPEETLLWAYEPDVFSGVFVREGYTLPTYDLPHGALSINGSAFGIPEYIFSGAAKAELLSLLETPDAAREPVPSQEPSFRLPLLYVFEEPAWLRYWLPADLMRCDEQLYLVFCETDSRTGAVTDTGAVRIASDGALAAELIAWEANAEAVLSTQP